MFKESFKYYKSKKPPPSLKDVVDFEDNSNNSVKIKTLSHFPSVLDGCTFGLRDPRTWKIFELIQNPGLLFITNPFTALGQRYWTIRCLRDYPVSPNRTNLKEKFELSMCKDSTLPLRWTTLGYHHNWDTKVYSEDLKNNFPNDLAELTKIVAGALGFQNFQAQAAIVNYYHFNSTLSGHTDHSEDNLEAPLFSISFGQSAIFLLGGRSIEDKPTAMLIRSGDIIAMTKKSRLCYHGVPKVLEDKNYSRWNDIDVEQKFMDENNVLQLCSDNNSWFPYDEFLRKSRINMNVRQVLKESQQYLDT